MTLVPTSWASKYSNGKKVPKGYHLFQLPKLNSSVPNKGLQALMNAPPGSLKFGYGSTPAGEKDGWKPLMSHGPGKVTFHNSMPDLKGLGLVKA